MVEIWDAFGIDRRELHLLLDGLNFLSLDAFQQLLLDNALHVG